MAVKRKAKVEIPTTPMKVKFYVAYQLSEDKKPIPEIVDWPSLLKEIEKLPFSLPSGSDTRYDKADDGEYAVWPEKVTWPCEIVAARIRRSNLPRKEAKGKVDPLPLLPAEGVMEGTHAVFFEDGGVAIRHNHGSMSASRLSYYFGQRVGRRIFLEPILDMSAMQRIKESGKIHELTLHWPGGMPPLKADNPLASMLKVLKGAPNQLKVSISIDPASESSWFKKLFKWANDTRKVAEEVDPADLGRSKPGVRAEIRHDGTKPNEVVDLLSDQLVTTVDVARVNTIERAVDKKDAFSKLKTAYKEKSKLTKLFLKTFFE